MIASLLIFLIFLPVCVGGNLLWGRRGGEDDRIPGLRFVISGVIGLGYAASLWFAGALDTPWHTLTMTIAGMLGYFAWRVFNTHTSLMSQHGKQEIRLGGSLRFIDTICLKLLCHPITDGQRRKFATLHGFIRWLVGGGLGLSIVAGCCCLLMLEFWWVYLVLIPFSELVVAAYALQRYWKPDDRTKQAEMIAGAAWWYLMVFPPLTHGGFYG